MVSKAFFKSRNITPFKRLLSIFYSHSFVASSKAVSVKNIGLKRDLERGGGLFTRIRGSQWGGGIYGYRLKFWLFYGYRLFFFSYG